MMAAAMSSSQSIGLSNTLYYDIKIAESNELTEIAQGMGKHIWNVDYEANYVFLMAVSVLVLTPYYSVIHCSRIVSGSH